MKQKVLITGGAGYVGSILAPKILDKGFDVRVLDIMWFGSQGLNSIKDKCEIIQGDIRDNFLLKESLKDIDYVIHLAAIANDPCGNLNPDLTKQVNYDATVNLIKKAKEMGIKRFVYASTSSVYGIKEEENITEELKLEPITIYSKTKALAEEAVLKNSSSNFSAVCIRSATVCGYSPRQRLDLVVNIFASDAITKKEITINGGEQKRPNVHIDDITNLYSDLLYAPKEKIEGKVFNYGEENYSLNQIGEKVRNIIGEDVVIKKNPRTADSRSYHISSDKIKSNLGFSPKKTIEDAVSDLKRAFNMGLIQDPKNSKYRNIARMKEIIIN